MNNYIVDASVVAKWYLPEKHTESATKLLNELSILHIPDLFYSEIANVLWKRGLRSEIQKKCHSQNVEYNLQNIRLLKKEGTNVLSRT